jgi:uncharacterized ubiquitin-like protein YukD
MNTHIDICLEFQGQQRDYRVPTGVTMGRLIELMHEVLKAEKLPEAWTLKLKYKTIKVDETDLIKDLPIGDGDIFLIIPTLPLPLEKEKQVNESI